MTYIYLFSKGPIPPPLTRKARLSGVLASFYATSLVTTLTTLLCSRIICHELQILIQFLYNVTTLVTTSLLCSQIICHEIQVYISWDTRRSGSKSMNSGWTLGKALAPVLFFRNMFRKYCCGKKIFFGRPWKPHNEEGKLHTHMCPFLTSSQGNIILHFSFVFLLQF